MELSDAQISYFVGNRLRLPRGKRAEFLTQVDYLIRMFKAKVDTDPTLGIKKFLKTGSLQKGTVLRPRDGFGVDADIAAYLKIDGMTTYNLESLHQRLLELLISIYPTKKDDDFTVQPRTLGIVFHVSGLEVSYCQALCTEGSRGVSFYL